MIKMNKERFDELMRERNDIIERISDYHKHPEKSSTVDFILYAELWRILKINKNELEKCIMGRIIPTRTVNADVIRDCRS